MMGCFRCPLSRTRTNVIWGEGPKNARVMFIGEAPGAVEDRMGRPFVGRSGKLLRRIMEEVGIDPATVYITNVVKCRPPENRTPTATEIRKCSGHVMGEIEQVNPSLIVFVGSTSTRALARKSINMEQESGSVFDWNGRDCMTIYHPGWIIRALSARRPTLERQLRKVTRVVDDGRPRGLERWK